MTIVDLTIIEERANLFSFLQQCQKMCLPLNSQSERAFNLLYQSWEKTSGKLFFLCYWNDYFRCGNIVLRVAKSLDYVHKEAQLLSEIGWICMEWEDFITSQQYFNESLTKYQFVNDIKGECRLLRYLGVLSYRQNLLDFALNYYNQAWSILESNHQKYENDDKWDFQQAELANVIGCLHLELRNFEESYHQLDLSIKNYYVLLEKYPELRDRNYYYLANPLLNLGKWHFLQQDYEQARRFYKESLKLSKEINRTDSMADVLILMAELAEIEGNKDEAIELASEAEVVAGIEILSVRDRAARLRERLEAQKS
ncbi:tetratricopeptide repeat protein [Nostoc sp. CALU 546]|uniref:tetratricopeptide repeat protein n=1 Tax=Nostoc sp. CALU 546 TaxID=1867241 RepID=UPI003B67AB42